MSSEISSEVAGTILSVEVALGDIMAVIESMKMELPVETSAAGTVGGIHCAEGDTVDQGQLLFSVD
jgi:biotin carboxyl carrier protein